MIPPATTPQEILDVEGDPVVGSSSGMEKAMLAQSAALTSLVAHLASSLQQVPKERLAGLGCKRSWLPTAGAFSML